MSVTVNKMDTLTVERAASVSGGGGGGGANLRRASLISEIYAEGVSSAYSARSRGKLHGLVGLGESTDAYSTHNHCVLLSGTVSSSNPVIANDTIQLSL